MIKFDNISFVTNKNNFVYKNTNIFIPSGSIISLTGVSGSGKTTFLKLVSISIEPKEGKLFLFGKEINKLNKKEILSLKKEFGIVYENNYFIENMNVQENIVFPLIYKKEKNKEIISALDELLPWLNLEKIKKCLVKELSRGELKLVQFARAIIGRPRILLLDNFFLDIENAIEKKIIYLLLALNKIGTTIIIIGEKPKVNLIKFDKYFRIKNKNILEIREEG